MTHSRRETTVSATVLTREELQAVRTSFFRTLSAAARRDASPSAVERTASPATAERAASPAIARTRTASPAIARRTASPATHSQADTRQSSPAPEQKEFRIYSSDGPVTDANDSVTDAFALFLVAEKENNPSEESADDKRLTQSSLLRGNGQVGFYRVKKEEMTREANCQHPKQGLAYV